MKLSTIAAGTEVLTYGVCGITSIVWGIGAIKALRRIHADWNDPNANRKYIEQRVRAAVGNLFALVGSLGMTVAFCYLSVLNGKVLVFGGVDLAAKIAALNFAIPVVSISGLVFVIGIFLVPHGAPSIHREKPISNERGTI